MKHEKTFEAINKLKEVELELHRLKNALELANKGLESERPWVGLTDEEIEDVFCDVADGDYLKTGRLLEAKLKEKNT